MEEEMKSSDHDLLVTIHTKLERALVDIKDLKDNLTKKVSDLELNKAEQKDLEEVQKDIKFLQKIAYGGLAILGFIQAYLGIFHKGL